MTPEQEFAAHPLMVRLWDSINAWEARLAECLGSRPDSPPKWLGDPEMLSNWFDELSSPIPENK